MQKKQYNKALLSYDYFVCTYIYMIAIAGQMARPDGLNGRLWSNIGKKILFFIFFK